eukprot:TRINITY_DN1610_c0_g1_i1.p1 TRINITY_DN1610_c0_g1~~TRINITY_DN1610_c0_g1_i1.p1  ORF type:complete len:1083 (-),score=286.17 TRINITY_DN1610_c0_g1_i1:32-3280(-)
MRSFKHFTVLVLVTLAYVRADLVLNEVMYHPKQSSDYEYVELYNTNSDSVSISGWAFSDDLKFTFPSGASIGGEDYVVIARNKAKLMKAYPNLSSSKVFGDASKLPDGKGTITLKDGSGSQKLQLNYQDDWQPLTDGFGPSLELVCPSANVNTKANWRSSPLPTTTDPYAEYSGTPGAANSWISCPAPIRAYNDKAVYFSEIMYNPRQENAQIDSHEFVELYYNGSEAIQLDNWRLVSSSSKASSLNFAFPTGTTVQPNSYFVVAKDKAKLAAVFPGITAQVFGDYNGELGNGGDFIAIVDSNGMSVDAVQYDDAFPWPMGADGIYGAQYKGYSLQRLSFNIGAKNRYNWIAADSTVGTANPQATETPNPTVSEITVTQAQTDSSNPILFPNQATTISVKTGPIGAAQAVSVEYYVDDVNTNGESTQIVDLVKGADDNWNYTFTAGWAANTAVNYRIKATFGGSAQVISPRSNDPMSWHGFFISPVLNTTSDVYHLFITPADWTHLWSALRTDLPYGLYEDYPDSCCVFNPTWNDEVPAVLGYQDKAYNVTAKYQGSPFNRARGPTISDWPYPGPSAPSPLLSLSWKIKLPDGIKINGRDYIMIIKPRDSGCNYLISHTMYNLARQLGLPSPTVKFSQLYINGGYYLYGMDMDYYSDDLIEAFNDDVYENNCPEQGSEEVGFMYKAAGSQCQGPAGPSSEEYLYPIDNCGNTGLSYTTVERFTLTYDLETNKGWGPHDNIANITSYLYGPNQLTFSETNTEARSWFNENFDVNLMLNYISLMSWAGSWDDLLGNHMLYQRTTDGKWTMTPWDMDSFFGLAEPCLNKPNCSIFLGEAGAPVGIYQKPGGRNILKDAFIKTFRTEYTQRIGHLASTVLSVENVNAAFDAAYAEINVPEFQAVPWDDSWSSTCLSGRKSFHAARNAYVKSTYPSTEQDMSICPDKPDITAGQNLWKSAPGQPISPFMKETTKSSITLGWFSPNPNGAAVSSYKLERMAVGETGYKQIYSGNDMEYTDDNLDDSKSYKYRLQASNSLGTSIKSDASDSFTPGIFSTTSPSDFEDSAASATWTPIALVVALAALFLF